MKIDEVNITVLGAAKVEGAWYIDCRCEVEANNKHNEININTAGLVVVNVNNNTGVAAKKERLDLATRIAGSAIYKLFGPAQDVSISNLGLIDDLDLISKVAQFNLKSQPQEPTK